VLTEQQMSQTVIMNSKDIFNSSPQDPCPSNYITKYSTENTNHTDPLICMELKSPQKLFHPCDNDSEITTPNDVK
jgi:hypothetical protein